MSLKAIRQFYGVPAKRGMRVVYTGYDNPRPGTITGSSGMYVRIRLDGERGSGRYHPTWRVDYKQQSRNNATEKRSESSR